MLTKIKHFGILVFLCKSLIAQDVTFTKKISVLSKDKNEFVPYAYLIISHQNSKLIFCTDENGSVNIQVKNYSLSDSILISQIGFQNSRMILSSLSDVVFLEPILYKLNEVIIKPSKVKYKEIGNPINSTSFSTQIGFGLQKVLFIPNHGLSGRICRIRYYMQSISNKDFIYRPFKVRLYRRDQNKDSIGTNLLENDLIVMLPRKGGNWLEVDISPFNIQLPADGVFVGLEAMQSEFYLKNGYIKSETTTSKKLNRRIMNSLSIGITRRSTDMGLQTWDFNPYFGGWNQKFCKSDVLLIQVIVEAK